MSVIYATSLKNTRLTAVVTALDAQSSYATLVIGTSALSGATGVLGTITLPKPSATVTSAVLTLAGVPLTCTAAATGTAAKAELRDSATTVWVSGLTVGISSADIIINSVAISSGQTIQLNSGTITHG